MSFQLIMGPPSELELQALKLIELFFEIRPIWPAPLLFLRLCEDPAFPQQLANKHFRGMLQRRLLPMVAQLAVTNKMRAWRLTWVRKGFDPCTEPEARRFQVIDFRSPPDHTRRPPAIGEPSQQGAETDSLVSQSETSREVRRYLHQVISFTMPPVKCQMWYGFSEIAQPMIKRIIDAALLQPIPTDHEASGAFGWFSKELYSQIRERMKHYLPEISSRYDRLYQQGSSSASPQIPVSNPAYPLAVEGFELFE